MEGSTTTILKYYSFAGGMVAMHDGTSLKYFLTDHLSSVIAVLDASGNLLSEQRYLPFGQVRDDVGTIDETDFGYTSQRDLPDLGLMDYRARFYSPLLGRFLQPDTLVPGAGNPQAFNRYSYGYNNPSRFSDPSGHLGKDNVVCTDDGYCGTGTDEYLEGIKRNVVSYGSIVVRFSFPIESLGGLSQNAEEVFDDTSSVPFDFSFPTNFQSFTQSEKAAYAGNVISVFNDIFGPLAPREENPYNVAVLVDWIYYEDEFTIPKVHLINNTNSFARILGISFEGRISVPKVATYGASESVGHQGDDPGILTMELSPTIYFPRDQSIFVNIGIKVSHVYPPAFARIIVPGRGIPAGMSEPIPWITTP